MADSTTQTDTVAFDSNGFAQTSGNITIYNFDQNGTFTGESEYYIPQYTGVPAFSTRTAPPAAEAGKVAVYVNDAWTTEEDHRGTKVWDKATGNASAVSAPGPIPSTVTTVEPTVAYPKWDDSSNTWVEDKEAAQAGLIADAKKAMATVMAARAANGWGVFADQPADVTSYGEALSAIISGKDTKSTSLPAAPADL